MSETPLTQEVIDGSAGKKDDRKGLISKAVHHPFLTGSAVLVGAGLAYAVAQTIKQADEDGEVARDVHIETSIAINKPPSELYSFWRNFQNLALFMKNLESVTELEPGKTHWVVRVNGASIEWDAEIYNEIENELIAWRSTEDADIVNAGSVRFQEAPEGHGTYVRVTMNYNPPAGKIGGALAQLFGAEPSQLIKDDLRRLKQIMEAGEISTIAGQSSGRADDAAPISHTHTSEESTKTHAA